MPGTKRTATGVFGALLGLVGLSAVAGVLITATITPAIAVSGLAAKGGIDMFDSLPDSLKIDTLMLPTVIYAKDANGNNQEMARFYEQNRSPVQYNQIAPVMIDALLSSEDNRFFQHGGIDLFGTTRALLSNALSRGDSNTQGGSSISQQYVKNVLLQKCEASSDDPDKRKICFEQAKGTDGPDGIKRKLQEMRYAISLEKESSKEDILLGYLNIASFGGVTYGIDAAAQRYFSVPASKLNLAEAATLAGMVQSPDQYRLDRPESTENGAKNGYALTKKRQQSVLERMLHDRKITQEEFDAAYKAPIKPKLSDRLTGCAAATGKEFFCQLVKEIIKSDPAFGKTDEDRLRQLNRGGMKVYTTLDARLQADATASMQNNGVPNKVEGMKFGSTTVSVESSTGRILSLVQNKKFSEDPAEIKKDPEAYSSLVFAADNTYGDASQGFEVGSTFKLFTLVDWLEKGHSVREVLDGTNPPSRRWSSTCRGQDLTATSFVGNFRSNPGWRGDVMSFTAQSLNSGYLAMAQELDVCDIVDVATKMGAVTGNGQPIKDVQVGTVIGPSNHSPLAMAGAFATIANKGKLCQPRAIDKIINPDGSEHALPDRTCKQVIPANVAATAAFAMRGVTTNGGTGTGANPFDGTDVVGKTGSHEAKQTWMIETSTRVTSVAWAGNYDGDEDIWVRGLENYRYGLARDLQASADRYYPAPAFPDPDETLVKRVYNDLPNVVGMTVADAEQRLRNAGFGVTVAAPANGPEDAGLITAQSPGAGQVSGFPNVTITPSNGKGIGVPNVVGSSRADAIAKLNGAGFNTLSETCKEEKSAPKDGRVTGMTPAGGTVVPPSQNIVIEVAKKKC